MVSTDSFSQIGRLMSALLCIVVLTSSSFVPAESATLGLVDKSQFPNAVNCDVADTRSVFTRVQTRESVSKVLLDCVRGSVAVHV